MVNSIFVRQTFTNEAGDRETQRRPTNTGEFTKRVREMSSQLSVTLYTQSIYPSAHKQLRRHLPNPFREFPCI